MTEETIKTYWQKFLATLPTDSPYHEKEYISLAWGDNPEMADELGGLIVQGIKTATSSAVWFWEAENEKIPEPGFLIIALDGRGEPLCIVETTDVIIRNYNEVDDDFAHAEGGGDLSLAYWRKRHKDFFSRTLPKIGKEFLEEMPLVCQYFKVIYK